MIAVAMLMAIAATSPSDDAPINRRCGTTVVGSYQKVIQLRAKDRTTMQLLVSKNTLAEPIPIVGCSRAVVFVRLKGTLYAADRWQVRMDQNFPFDCSRGLAGRQEWEVRLRFLNAVGDIKCRDLTSQAAPASQDGKRK